MNCEKCNKTNFTSEDMKTDDVLRIISQACDLGLRHIHFTGGEPTIHEDFIEMIKYCKDRGLRVDASSNGMFDRLTAEKICEAGLDSINISWDFIDKKPQSLDFNELKNQVFINHMVMPSNYRELPSFLEYVANHYPNVLDIQLMPPRGGATLFTKKEIDDYNNNIAKEAFVRTVGKYQMVDAKVLLVLADKEAVEGIYHKKIDWPCHRARSELRVGTKGFTTCTYLYRDGHVLCGLDKSTKEAWDLCKGMYKASSPPIPGMCDKSCSPEVCYFNYFVEEGLKN